MMLVAFPRDANGKYFEFADWVIGKENSDDFVL